MLLLVGLGNPGEKYANHRHNVGFMAVEAVAEAHGFGPARGKFQGALQEGFLAGRNGREKALILKPQTFMNESGRAVGEAMRFYKLTPADVVVFYDELDLAPGKLRMKTGGGAAGHNGIRSIDAHIGNNFRRVRIGIGHPGDKARVTGHVLGDFAKADRDWLEAMLGAIADAAPLLNENDNNRFQTAVAHKLAPARPAKEPAAKATAGRAKTAPAGNAAEDAIKDARDTAPAKQDKNPFAEAFQHLLRGKK